MNGNKSILNDIIKNCSSFSFNQILSFKLKKGDIGANCPVALIKNKARDGDFNA
jgi:hypothetical protein